jgi:hypothetical protein
MSSLVDRPAEFGTCVGADVEEEAKYEVVNDWDNRELGKAWTPRVGKGEFWLKGFPNNVGQFGAGGIVVYFESGVPEGLSVAHWLCSAV